MTARAGRRRTWIAWYLMAAGAALFAGALGDQSAGVLTARNIEFATAGAGILWLMLNADPAWLLSLGIATGIFNGNWDNLGGFNSVVAPDRVLIGAGLVALILRIPPQAKDRPPIRERTAYWFLGAAALYVTISAIWVGTFTTNVGFFRLLDRFGLLPFLMFAIAPIAFRTRRQRHILLGALVVVGAYVGFVTWADALKLDGLVWPGYIKDPSVGITQGRGRGPFAAADANGLALLACACAALIGSRVWSRRWVRVACVAIALMCLGGTFLTLTRSVWIGTAAALIVTMLSFRELRPFTVPVAAAAYASVLLSLAVVPGLAKRADDRQNDERPVWDRKNSNRAALRMLADRPLLGFGWDRYTAKNSRYFVMAKNYPLTGQRYPLHNVYLSNAVELGVVGVAIWLAAVLACLVGAIMRRGPPEMRPWRIALVAIFVQWIAVSALAPFPYSFPNLLLWTWAGLVSGLAPEQLRAADAIRAYRLVPAPA